MEASQLWTFVILGVSIVLFLSERLRPDLVALLVVVALAASGVLPQQDAFSGFSSSAVITIMAIFILAEGLLRSGVTDRVGAWLLRIAGSGQRRLTVVVMVAGAFLSLFMNNIAAASVLLPAVSGAARKSRVHPSRLMMPLAFSTILGGMATLLTSANIVVSSLLRREGYGGFGLLDFVPLGIPIVIVGIAYMALAGIHLLPTRVREDESAGPGKEEADLLGVYRLGERLFRARIPAGSMLVDRALAQSTLREGYGLTVVAIEHAGRVVLSPPPDAVFHQGDVVLFKGNLEEFRARDVEPYLEILPAREWHEVDLESPTMTVIEVMLSPRSPMIGKSLSDLHFRERFGMTVLAIWRRNRQFRTGLRNLPLEFGDALLVQGPRSKLPVLRSEPGLIVLQDDEVLQPPVMRSQGRFALIIMCGSLLGAAIQPPLVGEIFLGGALVMLLLGILNMDDAYRAIDWRSIFLIAGMLPMGTAMLKSGAANAVTDELLWLVGRHPGMVAASLFLLGTLLTQAMSGAAVAAVLAPVAIRTAHQTGLPVHGLAMAAALSTSMAFLTPLGHPVNILVMGEGGYRFRDYYRVGGALVVLLFLAVMIGLRVIWKV